MMIDGIDLVLGGAMMTAYPHRRDLSCEDLASMRCSSIVSVVLVDHDLKRAWNACFPSDRTRGSRRR
jgi:hypothetical protein